MDIQTIKYCDKTVTITYKVEVISPLVPNPVNYPTACPNTPITLISQANPSHPSMQFVWSNNTSLQTLNSLYSDKFNTEKTETVIISYCKNVPGSQEIKFEQKHVFKTLNPTVSAPSEVNLKVCPTKDTFFRATFESNLSRIGFEWDDKSKFPEYNFKYSTANLNQMNTVTMKFYCDDKSIEPYMTITQKHIAMLDENCVNVKFPNVVSINFENENNRVFKPFFVNEEDKSNLASYKLKIYNRWGNKVFESSKVSDSWNLQYKDEPAAIDTYIYI